MDLWSIRWSEATSEAGCWATRYLMLYVCCVAVEDRNARAKRSEARHDLCALAVSWGFALATEVVSSWVLRWAARVARVAARVESCSVAAWRDESAALSGVTYSHTSAAVHGGGGRGRVGPRVTSQVRHHVTLTLYLGPGSWTYYIQVKCLKCRSSWIYLYK